MKKGDGSDGKFKKPGHFVCIQSFTFCNGADYIKKFINIFPLFSRQFHITFKLTGKFDLILRPEPPSNQCAYQTNFIKLTSHPLCCTVTPQNALLGSHLPFMPVF